ncbi:hypothetical protein A2763_01455 [Candidatus Kaiserbacteria bacterium RIFCSPHIGHO2_01_FULL_54_36]|uniref:histidine kinase n=1 Tax=Candidatus Kaiserbacteria bacterium RIFCSPHIGHO2_01_FULL_54_36 TaxID=1798482 RepID=A0A1F6CMP5_9BACT|nr:MAG: hypothetical protein A2763_01455 [Candidatus Kaiserbacteria bacterium RIFCSPHIGHO2_01_FULL_54_36]OGG75782.1 MAG: hypothetical protein A3A41_00225 [Candidatus Kaiserbacteria bacterium RIFCSPLOWO2_01_FULL_54_22]
MSRSLEVEYQIESRDPFKQYVQQLAIGVAIFVAYLITARIGLSIHPVNTFATLIWPPTGIALAVLLIYGYRFSPAIALAAFTVNFWMGAGPVVAFFIAIGNTLGPVLGAYFLKNYIGFKPLVSRVRDNVGIVGVAFVGSIVSATIGITSLWLGGSILQGTLAATWVTWWIGDTLGILIFAPLMLKWLHRPVLQRTKFQVIEMWAAIAAVACVSFFVFWSPQTHAYYLFIPLTWAALRTGPRGTTLAVFVSAAIAVSGTLAGFGPFPEEGLIPLQLFVGTMSALFLIFAAVVEERRQTMQRFEGQIGELEQAFERISLEDEAKKEFLAVLAHELRNPLATVLSSVELLKLEGASAANAGAHIQTINDRVHAMASLLEDLLDISRISKKKLKLQKEIVAVAPLIERAVRMVQGLIRSLGHHLTVTKQDSEIFVEVDPIRFEQIVVNLLNNAAKYTDAGGKIMLTVRREGGFAVISVRDSGIGIPHTMLTRIFEPFFQIDRGKPTTEGLGIGLALTHQLVEMHGGTIEAISRGEGYGSEFVVRIPLAVRTEPSAVKMPGKPALKPTKNSLRILVVDDNRAAADGIGRLLELRGHHLSVAYSGAEAIEKATEERPQVIILDIGLPDMDGYEVARALQQKRFSGTLIALTGYGQESDKEKALEAGFHHHLTKPVGLKEIEAVLNKIPGIVHQTPRARIAV